MRPKGPKKYFLEAGPPVISGSGWPPPPPYLKVWICHCFPIAFMLCCTKVVLTYCLWLKSFGVTIQMSEDYSYWAVLLPCVLSFLILFKIYVNISLMREERVDKINWISLICCSQPESTVEFLCRPVRLACGQQHTSVVSSSGDVYTWGRSQKGRYIK